MFFEPAINFGDLGRLLQFVNEDKTAGGIYPFNKVASETQKFQEQWVHVVGRGNALSTPAQLSFGLPPPSVYVLPNVDRKTGRAKRPADA